MREPLYEARGPCPCFLWGRRMIDFDPSSARPAVVTPSVSRVATLETQAHVVDNYILASSQNKR